MPNILTPILSRWDFLTGPEPEIRRLAVNDFQIRHARPKTGGGPQQVPEDLFIHSTYFTLLVDQQGGVRGWNDKDRRSLHAYFDSEDEAAQAELLKAINQLLAERPK